MKSFFSDLFNYLVNTNEENKNPETEEINEINSKNQTSSIKNKHTNFEEMLSKYKKCNFNIKEEEELINDLETVFKYYKKKKSKIEKYFGDEKII